MDYKAPLPPILGEKRIEKWIIKPPCPQFWGKRGFKNGL
jgi:hypothetical protein